MQKIIFILGVFVLIGCSSFSPEYYAGKGPPLKLDQFFNGRSKAWGVVTDRSGKVLRRFTATLEGEWKGSDGILREDFLFDDGKTQKREWRLRKVGENSFEGRADDVEGLGTGTTSGFAMNWKYVLKIPVGSTIYNIPFDDSMFLVDEKSVINRARMSKFGFSVGEIIIFIQKD